MLLDVLNGQDIVVLAKLVLSSQPDVSSVQLAKDLGLPQPQVFRALRRAEDSRVIAVTTPPRGSKSGIKRVNHQNLYELLAFGVPYIFPAHVGRLERGVPTAGSAPILHAHFAKDPEPVVWPHPEGTVRGMSIEPLHPCVPGVALQDRRFYDLLALIDAVRGGKARERKLARETLKSLLL